jgi:hypothetical protein
LNKTTPVRNVIGKGIADHAFEPSPSYPPGEGCAHIVAGEQWTTADPQRCRKPESEHLWTMRDRKE